MYGDNLQLHHIYVCILMYISGKLHIITFSFHITLRNHRYYFIYLYMQAPKYNCMNNAQYFSIIILYSILFIHVFPSLNSFSYPKRHYYLLMRGY